MSSGTNLPSVVFVFVHRYLNEVSPALSRMFHFVLELISGDSQTVDTIKELERQETFSLILGYGDGVKLDSKIREQHRKEARKRKKQLWRKSILNWTTCGMERGQNSCCRFNSFRDYFYRVSRNGNRRTVCVAD